jgi:hypothetical protein
MTSYQYVGLLSLTKRERNQYYKACEQNQGRSVRVNRVSPVNTLKNEK